MDHLHGSNPALTVSIALAAGLVAQAIAHHVRIPGIVLLLATGALLGPDVVGVVDPASLGNALHYLVGFAVAVILFEGGLNLDRRRLHRESRTIQQLITIGAAVTAVGAALAARTILGWEWRASILFGTLVIVTGPTVVGPLVRRIRLKKHLQTVLEAEGVLIDPIGAIIAVVALDVTLRPSVPSFAMGVLEIAASLGVGSLLGLAGGYLVARLLRHEHFIPEGLENVFALSMILALFHFSNELQPESGIAAVTIAGVVVGNVRTRVHRDLKEFKEQLTVMLIGMLFVILAADVRFSELRALGTAGLGVVAALMFVVRPAGILLSTWGGGMTWRDKLFLSWIAPRGIVAAAIASFFALEMNKAGVEGGDALRALVFLVIAVTVTVQGLTGGLLARGLGLRRVTDRGWGILGANALGLALGRALRERGEEVTFLDANADLVSAAEAEEFPVVFGNALSESTLLRAGLDGLAGCIGLTLNEEVNLLFASKAREEHKVKRCLAALHARDGHISPEMLRAAGAATLFGSGQDLRLWESCARRALGDLETWVRGPEPAEAEAAEGEAGAGETERSEEREPGEVVPEELQGSVLALVRSRGGRTEPMSERTDVREEDEVTFLVFRPRREEVDAWLLAEGWHRPDEADPDRKRGPGAPSESDSVLSPTP
jgi:NhaP-type Na+/H+ or K+/H+ antiporter